MKSQVSVLFHVLTGIFLDAKSAYPELRCGFLKDEERIALNFQKRGLAFFTLDLPCLNALLLEGLEMGRLSLSGPLSRRVSKRIQVPKFLSGLWLRVFEKDSCLRQDVDTTAILFLRQITTICKNLEVECSQDRISASIRSFLHVEQTLRSPTLQWVNDSLGSYGRCSVLDLRELASPLVYDDLFGEDRKEIIHQNDMNVLGQVQRVADLIVGTLETFEPLRHSADLSLESRGIGFRHGPGAVAERKRQEEKSSFPYWPHKLEKWFPFGYCGQTIGATRDSHPVNHEVASRLICVPKTAKGPRLIAAEPVAHQWCQQIIRHWIDDQLTKSSIIGDFIDFRNQSLSGDMVLQASLDRKLATVDLSDASDRLSCWTVERVFRSNQSVLHALHAARTRYLRQDIDRDMDSFIKLKKFATQGTATTFPVQSLVFLVIALAAAIGDSKVTMRSIKKLRNRVRVFGDDIILPTHGYGRLVRIMELLQLKVNLAKSYKHGHYRESCGVDGAWGDDVTPCSPETFTVDGPASCQAVIDTSNNLFNKGFWNASHNLISTLPPRVQRGLRIVGRNEAGFAGLTSFCGSDERHLDKRWNSRLHRYEGRIWSVSPKSDKRDRQGFEPLLEFFASVRHQDDLGFSLPRITSSFGSNRKARNGLLWEPLNTCALGYPGQRGGTTRWSLVSDSTRTSYKTRRRRNLA